MAVGAAVVVMAGLCGRVQMCRDGGIGSDIDGAVGSDGGHGGLGCVWSRQDGGGGGVEVVVLKWWWGCVGSCIELEVVVVVVCDAAVG